MGVYTRVHGTEPRILGLGFIISVSGFRVCRFGVSKFIRRRGLTGSRGCTELFARDPGSIFYLLKQHPRALIEFSNQFWPMGLGVFCSKDENRGGMLGGVV